MKIEVLVAAMNQTDHSLIERMNISSDAIIGNQCNINSIEKFIVNGKEIMYLNFAEKGVGLNRNNVLMRAKGDICLFADDDMKYVENYESLVLKQFEMHPDADVIIFNIKEKKINRYINKKVYNVGWHNFMRFGAVRIAFRRLPVYLNGISFNLMFGGGAKYSHGEDTLFLASCLRGGLKIIAVPEYIAELEENRSSTWFQGYTEQFLKDKGILFYYISKRYYRLLCLQYAIRHRKKHMNTGNWLKVHKKMLEGVKELGGTKK